MALSIRLISDRPDTIKIAKYVSSRFRRQTEKIPHSVHEVPGGWLARWLTPQLRLRRHQVHQEGSDMSRLSNERPRIAQGIPHPNVGDSLEAVSERDAEQVRPADERERTQQSV